jgi:hypothetical protein
MVWGIAATLLFKSPPCLMHSRDVMNTPPPEKLLEEFTLGFAFDERVREQLSYSQLHALADMFLAWAQNESSDPKRSAWLAGVAEGLLAEAENLGPDWQPPEPEKLTLMGFLGRKANGDLIRPEQTPRGR